MKFIADVMVGRLAKYLRMAGYDVIYINDITDDEILRLAKKDGRIVLTRDRLMLQRRDCKNNIIKSLLIKDDMLAMQLNQIRNELLIEVKPGLNRCIECNMPLEEIKKDEVKDRVPPFVFKTQNYFLFCRGCGKYYWRGTHYKNIYNFFKNLKDE